MLTSYLLFLPVTVIISWLVVFTIEKRNVFTHDKLFLVYSICCAISYSIIITFLQEDTGGSYLFIIMDHTITIMGLSICPLLFLYIRSITRDSSWHRWYWWLFAPAFILWITSLILSLYIGWDRLLEIRPTYYSHFIPGPYSAVEHLYGFFNITLFNITEEIVSLTSVLLCILYLVRYRSREKNFYSNVEDSSSIQMHGFLASSVIIMVTLTMMTFCIRRIRSLDTGFFLLMSLHISFWLHLMCRNANGIILTKEKIAVTDSLFDENNSIPSSMDNLDSRIMDWQLREDKPFCRDGISLADVAQDTDINTRVLSTYINKTKGTNFRRWINILRIEEAKRLMTENPTEKLTYIAMICGFADIATFSKTFRLIEGCSPNEFRQKVNP